MNSTQRYWKQERLAIGHLWSMQSSLTTRMVWRAVTNNEINFNRLKARKKAVSHQRSKRRFETARVLWRAVANDEINYNLLKARSEGCQSSKFKTVYQDCPSEMEGSGFY